MPFTPTKILFCHPDPAVRATAQAEVQLVKQQDNKTYIVTDKTPFHPVSHIWPDHPSDQGTIEVGDNLYSVEIALTGAIELATGELYVDQAIPVKRDQQGWIFVVVHVVDQWLDINTQQQITLNVDLDYQHQLSCGHSAGHLASLALNKVLDADYWRKDAPRVDELGHHDFNGYAQEKSSVAPTCCTDDYRLGKTLRKRGLNSTEIIENIKQVESDVNQQLILWLALESNVLIESEGDTLTDSRYWVCQLGDEGVVKMPCGGTHINHFSQLPSLEVSLNVINNQAIVMKTSVNLTIQMK
ncbi:alanyl-tRNA editing protein [Vibrio sp. SS-MA-C1-2]|uniref:alanyl-tRNA editing protein n=1 Tax=Vibrio sp. SS-MA-C1-2 TaxID=2908646 RepID=UPI001F21FC4B|nr:alanyl-tRNA editing protein [Vibrio sp. SS-MA-C1-2]UJF18953.1 alanyl-tRNA editing protein [Vibrio sp. SS-MA-C1-2]